MSTDNQEIATVEESAVDTHRQEMMEQFRRIAESMKAANADEDPEAATEAMIAQIMDAMTVEDVLGTGVTGLQSILNKPIYIDRVELRESDFTEGLGAYAVMHCRNDDLEKMIVTTGSFSVIAALVKFQALNAYPVRCMAVQSAKPTKSGYYPLSLARAPEPRVKVTEPADEGNF